MRMDTRVHKHLISYFERLINRENELGQEQYSIIVETTRNREIENDNLEYSLEEINELVKQGKIFTFFIKKGEDIIQSIYLTILDENSKNIINNKKIEKIDMLENTGVISFSFSNIEKKIQKIILKFMIVYCENIMNLNKIVQVIQLKEFNEQQQYTNIFDYLKSKYSSQKNLDDDIELYRSMGWDISKVIYDYFTHEKFKYGILVEYKLEKKNDFELMVMSEEIDNTKPLLILIHPLSGDVGVYNKLADSLSKYMNIISIKSVGLSNEGYYLDTVESMAELYLEKILKNFPDFDYNIFGFSFGGLIANEIANKMNEKGINVKSVIMLETLLPKTKEEKEYFSIDESKLLLMNAKYLLLKLEGKKALSEFQSPNIQNKSFEEILEILSESIYIKSKKLDVKKIKSQLINMTEVHVNNLKALKEYDEDITCNDNKNNCYHFISKNKNATSSQLLNPYYLEDIQKKMGGLETYFSNIEKEIKNIQIFEMDFDSHMDIFDNDYSVKLIQKRIKQVMHIDNNKTEIAIIGISGKFPQSDSVDELWSNLLNKKISIEEFPENRNFNFQNYYSPNLKTPNKTYLKRGGFLKNIKSFDPLFFNISPKEAEYIDPSEKLFLEESWKAIEDAGYDPFKLEKEKWGVFSCAKGDYGVEILKKAPTYYMPTDSNANGRLSYFLNLNGPSMNIDTACSSGLTAISIACDNIALKNCDGAIVGGGGINSSLNTIISSSQSLLFSPSSSCNPFDQKADGTVIGESICTVILKEKNKAINDGDYIYGIIKGWGTNQDGRTNGLTAPSGNAQYNLREDVFKKAGIEAKDIDYIETHGTGTSLGDRIEFNSLQKTFENCQRSMNRCILGSIKSNIGHTFFASGLVSVIKVILSFKNKMFPPQAGLDKVHKDIDIESSPFVFLKNPEKWEGKKISGINSFGATGSNAHVILSNYENKFDEVETNEKVYAFPISANNIDSLRTYLIKMKKFIKKDQKYFNDFLCRIAYTLQTGRTNMKYRVGFLASNIEELEEKIDQYLEKNIVNIKDTNKEIYNSKSEELLEKWLNEENVYWDILYSNKKINKLPIPTYEFHSEMNEKFSDIYLYKEVWSTDFKQNFKINKQDFKNKIIFLDDAAEIKKINSESLVFNKNDLFNLDLKKYIAEDGKYIEIIYKADFLRNTIYRESQNIIKIIKEINEINKKNIKLILTSVIYNNQNEHELLIGIQKALNHKINIVTITFEKECHNSIDVFSDDDIYKVLSNTNTSNNNIKFKNNKKYYLEYKETKLTNHHNTIKQKGVYLVIGGLGGIGKIISKYIVDNYDCEVIILGRSKLNCNINEYFDKSSRNYHYFSTDVTNLEDFTKTFNKIKEKFSEIRGIFNLAGSSNKTNILRKNPYQFHKTIDVKRKGIDNINKIFENQDLDFVCNFSSTSAILGDFGVVDYTVANRFLNSNYYNNNITIQWPLWENGNMTLGDEQDEMYLKSTGQEKLKDSEGVQILEYLLFNRLSNIAVFKGDYEKITKLVDTVQHNNINKKEIGSPKINWNKEESSIEKTVTDILKSNQGIIGNISIKHNLIELGIDSIHMLDINRKINEALNISIPTIEFAFCEKVEDIISKVESYTKSNKNSEKFITTIKEIIAELLSIPIENISNNDNIYSLGIDSINMFDITKKINEKFSCNITSSQLMNFDTIDKLTDYIESLVYEDMNLYKNSEVELPEKVKDNSNFLCKSEVEDLFYGKENVDYVIRTLMEDSNDAEYTKKI